MVAEVIQLHDWKQRLQRRANGTPFGDERNILVAFEYSSELRGLLAYNEFSDRIVLKRELPMMPEGPSCRPLSLEWSDQHLTWLTAWLQSTMPVKRDSVQNAIITIAQGAAFHPIKVYLAGLQWDGVPRIENWLIQYLGARDDPTYLSAVGSKFLIGAIARVFNPGCQMDTMLVLEGPQGLGKSSAVHFLGGPEWTRDVTGDLSTKDAVLNIQGVWFGEMAELTSIRRSEQEHIKAFVSRRLDRYRPPYGRNTLDRPRQCVFIATTNEQEYLQDPSGARRFWPIECSRIDLEGITRDRNQLWAEAFSAFKAGRPWYLDPNESARANLEQNARQRLSPVDATVLEYLDAMRSNGQTRVEMRQILAEVFDTSTKEDPAKAGGLASQIARTITSAGWLKLKPRGRGGNRKQEYLWKEP